MDRDKAAHILGKRESLRSGHRAPTSEARKRREKTDSGQKGE